MEQGVFPTDSDPCYLAQKAEVALRLPMQIITKKGLLRFLNQLVMSSLIRTEECKAGYHWPYKAEVVFAMMNPVPMPMLATSAESKRLYGSDLPHSSNPFARPPAEDWLKYGVYGIRRPDIILVQQETQRWPGRAATYFDGKSHADNLKMLIEMKFPGDVLSKGQENDYQLIATRARFGVMRVSDNRSAEQREYDKQYNQQHKPSAERYILPPLIPGRNDNPTPQPVPVLPQDGAPGTLPQPLIKHIPLLSSSPWDSFPSYEDWLILGQEVASLAENGWDFVREETREKFHQFGQWVQEAGQWIGKEIIDPVTQQATLVFSWVSDKTGEVINWTGDQLQALWRTVQQGMDFTLDYLKSIDWVQVLQDIGNGLVQLVIFVAEVIAVVIVSVVVAAAIVVLVAALASGIGEALAGLLALTAAGVSVATAQ